VSEASTGCSTAVCSVRAHGGRVPPRSARTLSASAAPWNIDRFHMEGMEGRQRAGWIRLSDEATLRRCPPSLRDSRARVAVRVLEDRYVDLEDAAAPFHSRGRSTHAEFPNTIRLYPWFATRQGGRGPAPVCRHPAGSPVFHARSNRRATCFGGTPPATHHTMPIFPPVARLKLSLPAWCRNTNR
jgi:hypothetical protein